MICFFLFFFLGSDYVFIVLFFLLRFAFFCFFLHFLFCKRS